MSRRGDESGGDEKQLAAERSEDPPCTAAVTQEIRCLLRDGHGGLHQWRSTDGTRSFEWG